MGRLFRRLLALALALLVSHSGATPANGIAEISRLKQAVKQSDAAKEHAEVSAGRLKQEVKQSDAAKEHAEVSARASAANATRKADLLSKDDSQLKAAAGHTADLEAQVKKLKAAAATAVASNVDNPSVLQSFASLRSWLGAAPYQRCFAGIAGVVGVLSALDAVAFGRLFIIVFAALVGGTIAFFEVGSFGAAIGSWGPVCVGLEGAAFAASAAIFGFDGFRLVVGGGFGLLIARVVRNFGLCKSRDDDIIWYSVAAFVGAAVLFAGQKNALAVLGPLVGGLMVASSVAFFVGDASAASTPWFDFLLALLGEQTPDKSDAFAGDELTMARYVCWGVWALIIVLGTVRCYMGRSSTMGRWMDPEQEPEDELEFGVRSQDQLSQMQRPLLNDAYRTQAPPSRISYAPPSQYSGSRPPPRYQGGSSRNYSRLKDMVRKYT